MKLFFKIVLFIFAMITTDGEVKSSTVVNILRKKTSSSVLPYAYTNTPINKCNPNDWYWHKGTAQLVSFTLNNGIDWITSFKGGINQQIPLLNFTHTTVGALTYTMTSSFMGGMVTNGFTTNMVRGVAAPGRIQIGQSFDKLGTVVKNPGLSITNFSKHGLNQTITRGVNPSTILNTVKNPVTVLQQSGGNYLHLNREAAVVINPTGRVVSTYPASMFDSSILNVLKGL